MSIISDVIRNQLSRIAATLLLSVAVLACGSPADAPAAIPGTDTDRAGWPAQVRFGMIPTETGVVVQWQPVFDHLEAELGLEIEATVGRDYAATINAAGDGSLDMILLGPKSYVTAREQGAAIEPVVKGVKGDTGVAGYNSLLITRRDSGIASIEDARGRAFAFIDPESTSGFLAPTVFFLERNIQPETYFSEVSFAGSHEAAALAVANGEVDLASNNNETLPRLFASGQIAEDDIRIIWESPLIPTDPISAQTDLPASFHTALRDAFLAFDDAATLAELQIQGWIPAADADYEVIRTLEATRAKLADAR